jgi:hypothetical protein
MKILFLHGWHSVPGGVKPTYLKDQSHEVINPALDDDDFDAALATAQAEFNKHQSQVVVGSSRGGAVAMNINSGDAKLVLLCPAWKNWGTAKTLKPGTVILHSRSDDVIPFVDSEELVRSSDLPAYTLIEVGSDHRLADPESLETMLEACRIDDDGEIENEEDILERDWAGLCYTAAIRCARDDLNRAWVVVHGTVWSDSLGKRIEHAWCEWEGAVVDLALPIGSGIIERERYYRAAQPEVRKVYFSEDALIQSIKTQHDGPWNEDEQLGETPGQ